MTDANVLVSGKGGQKEDRVVGYEPFMIGELADSATDDIVVDIQKQVKQEKKFAVLTETRMGLFAPLLAYGNIFGSTIAAFFSMDYMNPGNDKVKEITGYSRAMGQGAISKEEDKIKKEINKMNKSLFDNTMVLWENAPTGTKVSSPILNDSDYLSIVPTSPARLTEAVSYFTGAGIPFTTYGGDNPYASVLLKDTSIGAFDSQIALGVPMPWFDPTSRTAINPKYGVASTA